MVLVPVHGVTIDIAGYGEPVTLCIGEEALRRIMGGRIKSLGIGGGTAGLAGRRNSHLRNFSLVTNWATARGRSRKTPSDNTPGESLQPQLLNLEGGYPMPCGDKKKGLFDIDRRGKEVTRRASLRIADHSWNPKVRMVHRGIQSG